MPTIAMPPCILRRSQPVDGPVDGRIDHQRPLSCSFIGLGLCISLSLSLLGRTGIFPGH